MAIINFSVKVTYMMNINDEDYDDYFLGLTPKEYELLVFLVERKNHVLSRDELLSGVWGYDYAGETRMVDIHVSHLREKIEIDPKNPHFIKTVRGFGYQFSPDLEK